MIRNYFMMIFCLLISLQAMSQQTISGNLQASDNTPLIGATIIATHTTDATDAGTTSDVNGNFSLDLKDYGNYSLVISY